MVVIRPDGCWVRKQAPQRKSGYANHNFHRTVWEVWNGKQPKGMELDHRCRRRECCNPDHLRLVTKAFNQHVGYVARTGQMTARDLKVARLMHDEVGKRFVRAVGGRESEPM